MQDMIGVLYEIDIKRNYDNYLHQNRGLTDIKDEAEAALKYFKSRFARTLLGILKVTQDNSKETWRFVPLQDFSAQSDIDWSKSVAEIDKLTNSECAIPPTILEVWVNHECTEEKKTPMPISSKSRLRRRKTLGARLLSPMMKRYPYVSMASRIL